jgi:hypothetical protein
MIGTYHYLCGEVLVIGLAVGLAVATSCGRGGPKYDRSTPEGTVRALFAALDKGRMPEDVERFFVEDREVAVWRMRCKHRGCSGGTIQKLTVEEQHEYRAVIRIDFEVTGNDGIRVMHGTDAPLILTREGKNWYIHQFGERRVIASGKNTKKPPIDSHDAGPRRDAD